MQSQSKLSCSFNNSSSLGKCLRLAILAGASAVLMAGSAFGANPTSWEVASEFDDQPGANCSISVWCYGVVPTVGSPVFTADCCGYSQNGGLELGWVDYNGTSGSDSRIYHNINPYIILDGTVPIPAHALILHPGSNCEVATLQFTVPYKGRYKISGQFYGIYDQGVTTTTDVHILYVNNNGVTPMWSGNIDVGAGTPFASFTSQTTPVLLPGNIIEFEVGCGNDGDWTDDWTGLNAVIEKRK